MDSQPLQPETRWPAAYARLLAFAALTLAAVAVWFRCRGLGHLPGLNGDEAWYGATALDMLREGRFWVCTPTGNPPNPFYLGPLVVLHAWFTPSVVLLRSVALASGLAALAVNWLLCRWVFDRATATASTMMLAVWPVMIAYSRFGWDASQSVLATLPVVYLSLATIRFPERRVRWSVLAAVSLLAAVAVHPTNVFAGAVGIAAAAAWRRPRASASPANSPGNRRWRRLALCAVVLAGLGASMVGCGVGDPARWLARAHGVDDLVHRGGLWHAPTLLARLHTGATAYHYIPGSRSWLEWPAAEASQQWGVDVALFWAALAASGLMLWRSGQRRAAQASPSENRRSENGCCPGDRVLLCGWGATLLAFLLVAGPSAMLPGWERYAMCLIAPTTLVLARGAVLACRSTSRQGSLVLASVAVLGGWFLVADFERHYFRSFRETAGAAHATFRTGPVEPRAAALELIDRHCSENGGQPTTAWIVASEWWNYWPLKYLAAGRPGMQVVRWEDVPSKNVFGNSLSAPRTSQSRAAKEFEAGESTTIRRCSTTPETGDSSRPPAKWNFKTRSIDHCILNGRGRPSGGRLRGPPAQTQALIDSATINKTQLRLALGQGRVWLVEFADSEAERESRVRAAGMLRNRLRSGGPGNTPPASDDGVLRRWLIRGYAGQPLLAVLRVE